MFTRAQESMPTLSTSPTKEFITPTLKDPLAQMLGDGTTTQIVFEEKQSAGFTQRKAEWIAVRGRWIIRTTFLSKVTAMPCQSAEQ